MGSTLRIRVGSRTWSMTGLAAVLTVLPVIAATAPAKVMAGIPIGVTIEAPSSAQVGDVVPLDFVAGVQRSWFPRDAILDLELSAGLRPVRVPDGCEFDGVAWRVRCELEHADKAAWEIRKRIDVLVTLEGQGFARAFLTAPGQDPLAWGSDGIEVTLPDAVRRYAPQLRFHHDETQWPESVENLLVDSSLKYAWEGCPDDTATRAGQVTADQLGVPGGGEPVAWPEDGGFCHRGDAPHTTIENTRPGGEDKFYSAAAMPGSKEGFYLSIGPVGQAGMRPSVGATAYDAVAPVYFQYRAPDPELGDGYIRYWVLYGCSYLATLVDPAFAKPREGECWHQGDWEGVAVRLDRDTGTATDIAYFAHEEPADIRVFAPDGPDPFIDPVLEVVAGDGEAIATHPVVYVGAGAHSSRTGAGDHAACLKVKDRIVYCGTDQTADDLRWDTWNDLRSAEDTWFGFGGAWGAVGPLAARLGFFAPGGPGLVDPLPEQWSDKDVPRCRAGEIHPESRGTGTSCDLGDESGTAEAAVPGEPTGVVVKAGRARVNESVTWPVTVSWDPVEDGTRVAVYLTAADPLGQFGRPTTCDDALTRLRRWADKNPDGGEPRYPNVLLATSDPGAGSVRYTGGGSTDYNGQPCAVYVRAMGEHGASALVEARGRFEP